METRDDARAGEAGGVGARRELMGDDGPLRIGILGAARIAPMALVRPARFVPEAQVTAVAARDPDRAHVFAAKYGIPRVHESYAALVADPDLDAVYNPLPNSLHCDWSIRALEAGKHVLCEKPIASNAEEAERMAAAAARTGRVLVEAFHYRCHPLAARVKEIVDGGALGRLQHIEAHMCIPLPRRGDIRYRYDLAGGATMDVGCYAINLVRFLAGAEPQVTWAAARLMSPDVDRYMAASFQFGDGRTGSITCSLLSAALVRLGATLRGERGELHVVNPFAPQFYHSLVVRTHQGRRKEHVHGEATYTHQLRSFVAAVRSGAPFATDMADAIANMRVIDAVYDAAGLRRRGA